MTLDKLKERLNELSWEEQMNFEMSERYPENFEDVTAITEHKIQELAQLLTPSLLDSLEREEGYIAWVLRLSPYVPDDSSLQRGQRFLYNPDSRVRYWASEIIRIHEL